MASGTEQLMTLAFRLGWRFVRWTNGGHVLLEHVGTDDIAPTGNLITLPKSVQSNKNGHSLPNLARELFRGAGVTPVRPKAVPGTRRKRPTGEAREQTETRAARRADVLDKQRAAMIRRRERELYEIRGLMRG